MPVFADKYSVALTEPKPFSFATSSRLGEPSKHRVENAHPNSVQQQQQQQQPQVNLVLLEIVFPLLKFLHFSKTSLD